MRLLGRGRVICYVGLMMGSHRELPEYPMVRWTSPPVGGVNTVWRCSGSPPEAKSG